MSFFLSVGEKYWLITAGKKERCQSEARSHGLGQILKEGNKRNQKDWILLFPGPLSLLLSVHPAGYRAHKKTSELLVQLSEKSSHRLNSNHYPALTVATSSQFKISDDIQKATNHFYIGNICNMLC